MPTWNCKKCDMPMTLIERNPNTICPNCGNKQKLSLSERVYSCKCKYNNDRDIKSAICIEQEAIKQVPMDRRDVKAREILTSTFFEKLATVNGIKVSKLKSMN